MSAQSEDISNSNEEPTTQISKVGGDIQWTLQVQLKKRQSRFHAQSTEDEMDLPNQSEGVNM